MKLWPLIFILGSYFSHWTMAAPAPRVNYDLSNGTLRNVPATNITRINLSYLNIRYIAENSLDSLTNAEALYLSNNNLDSLPPLIFSKLVNLRSLSLANNKISSLTNVFVGLTYLARLDLSGNSISSLKTGDLFGLTQYVELNVERNPITEVSTRIFKEPPLSGSTENEKSKQFSNTIYRYEVTEFIDCEFRMAVDNIVEFMGNCELSDGSRLLENHVIGHKANHDSFIMDIYIKEIKGFKHGWYKEQNIMLPVISLHRNQIQDLSPELINDLPPTVKWIQVTGNDIPTIKNNGLENPNSISIHLSLNKISTIEDGAFKKLNLDILDISHNELRSTAFVRTLPTSITELCLDKNRISETPWNSFEFLKNLKILSMKYNQVEYMLGTEEIFKNLKNLVHLNLAYNQIYHIAPGLFRGLNKLDYVDLSENEIRRIPNLFEDWNNDTKLNFILRGNPIHTIEPEVLSYRSFSHLEIPIFELVDDRDILGGYTYYGTSVRVFDKCNISHLTLSIQDTSLFGMWFKGISGLDEVNLKVSNVKALNKNGIAEYLGNITKLSLEIPDLEIIDNGALFGLSSEKEVVVSLKTNNLKIIRGGLFDDYWEHE